jgi:hypothetical protein
MSKHSKRQGEAANAPPPAAFAPVTEPFFSRGVLRALGAILALSLLMFADLLFAPVPKVISQPGTDLTSGEADSRAYVIDHIRRGKLPLWCPHIYSGTPWLSQLQSGALYPVNLLFLPFSTERMVVVDVWLHLFLLGAGLCLWLRALHRSPLACFVAGAIGMFCGPVFLHVYAGHLNNIAAMTWAPWLFLGARLVADGRLRCGAITGAIALGLQFLSGHIQYAYYTCIATALYALACLPDTRRRLLFLAVMASLASVAVALAAAQILPGIADLSTSARGGKGTAYAFAAMFSFPPENVLTLLSPDLFGNITSFMYWGRCNHWEMTLFYGTAGLVLTCAGLASADSRARRTLAIPLALLFILALGSHTPLFPLLFKYAPGFNSLRGNSKFTFPCILFALALAGYGVDALLQGNRRRRLGWSALASAAACAAAALALLATNGGGLWRDLLGMIRSSGESYLPPQWFDSAHNAAASARFAAFRLLIPAASLGIVGAVLLAKLRPTFRASSIALLAIAEVFLFSRSARVTFSLAGYREDTGQEAVRRYVAGRRPDERLLLADEPNTALYTGANNIWGYGVVPQRRYLEFMAWTQGIDPDLTTQYVPFQRLDPLFALLRLRRAIVSDGHALRLVDAPAPPMEHVQLISRCRVLPGRDAIFQAMRESGFDPRSEVLLEREPNPRPIDLGSQPGTVRITDSTNDWLDIEADVKAPAILLVTDPYAPSWQAVALPGGVPQAYEVLPADYILRAIPLGIGHHKLRLEFRPAGFALGLWTSFAAWLGLLGWAMAIALSKRRRGAAIDVDKGAHP